MISRSGTRRSLAASGVEKILREEGNGPVVTAATVVSGLGRMFMGLSLKTLLVGRHCEEPATKLRSNFALERRSNPDCSRRWISGLLRFARNDSEKFKHHAASFSPS